MIKIDYEKIATDNGWRKSLNMQTDYYFILDPRSVIRWEGEDSDASPKLAEIGRMLLREEMAGLTTADLNAEGPCEELMAYQHSLMGN